MHKFMRFKKLILTTTFVLTMALQTAHATEESRIYANEQAITFSTYDGHTTEAYSGFINVPENRNNPESRLIKVHYVRFPSTNHAAKTPIVYLAGGPGGSGINTAKYPNFRFPLFMALREFGDVIALDQRGTGLSEDIPVCNSSQHVDFQTEQTEIEVTEQYRSAALECADFWREQGVDIRGYNTQESAHDLNDLREHFRAKKVSLWGISYGSHLAFATMKLYPSNIERVIIASAEGLDQTVKLPQQTDAYFARLQEAINTQQEARSAYPNIIAMMHRVHERLLREPLRVSYPSETGDQEILFQKLHMQMLAAAMIADPHRHVPVLLSLYRSLDQGNTHVLEQVLQQGHFEDSQIRFRAMPLAMDIASGISEEELRSIQEQAKNSLLGLSLNFPMPQLTQALPGLDLGDSFREKPVNEIPTLLFSGTLDGRTYPESQHEATAGLSDVTRITVVNAGHNLFTRSPEVLEAMKAFLAGDEIEDHEIEVELPEFLLREEIF